MEYTGKIKKIGRRQFAAQFRNPEMSRKLYFALVVLDVLFDGHDASDTLHMYYGESTLDLLLEPGANLGLLKTDDARRALSDLQALKLEKGIPLDAKRFDYPVTEDNVDTPEVIGALGL